METEGKSFKSATVTFEADRFRSLDLGSILPDISTSLPLGIARAAIHRQPKARLPDFLIEFVLPAIATEVCMTFMKYYAGRAWLAAKKWTIEKILPEIKRQHLNMSVIYGREPHYYGVVSLRAESGSELRFHVFSSEQIIAAQEHLPQYLHFLDITTEASMNYVDLYWDYDRKVFRTYSEGERVPDFWQLPVNDESRWESFVEPSAD